MTKHMQDAKAVRKTFTIPSYLVDELEEYSKDSHQKQSHIVATALELYINNQTKSQKVQKRLNALDNLIGIAPKGSLEKLDKKDLKEIRASNA